MNQPTFSSLLLFVITFLLVPVLPAQDSITVDATGEIRILADRVTLQIQVTATADSPEEAFREHKRQEEFLSRLLAERGLKESIHSFEPVSIGSRMLRDDRQFTTSQSVRVTLSDFSLFEEIQLLLIQNGFERFSGSFTASELKEAERRALTLALTMARERAEHIAAAMGRSVRSVHSVNHSSYQTMGYAGTRMAEMRLDSASMMDFDASIPVSSSVTVVFHLSK